MQQRVPSPVTGIDVYKLPLGTLEGFVLSRVDGSASVEDISITCGIDQDRVLSILQRLSELGAVELGWLGPRRKPAAPQKTASHKAAPQAAPAAGAAAPPATPDAHFARKVPRYDKKELDADVQIVVEVRKRILDAYYAIEDMNLYQTLGVRRDADKKMIRNAYFELSKLFHPDAYFGKSLGAFKPKMEAVFKRLTEAYEILGKPKKRADYDEYLASTEQTRKARQTLDSLEFAAVDVDAHRAAQAAPRQPEARIAPEPIVPPPPPVPAEERSARKSSRPQPTSAERRARVRDRLLQRMKSVGSVRPPPPPASEPPPSAAQASPQQRKSMVDGLRQSIRASASVTTGTPHAQLQTHLKKAKDAEQAGDILSAASQLQLALAMEPNNPDLIREYDRVSKVVSRNLAANYEKQAQYEEKTGNWQAAARSWSRASDGKPEDAVSARRAAQAMLKTSADLHRAQSYAQKAVLLDSKNVENLTVLARVYLAAGLKLNALRELEKAAQLAPKDEMVNNLLREVR